jgi:FG-GAP-like repeat/FG-GAP repeat
MKTMARSATLVIAVSMCVGVGSVHAAGAMTPSNSGLLPTSMQECMNDGWRSFEVFKGKGDCVSFVATRRRNRPAFEPPRIFRPPVYYPPGPRAFVTSGDFNGDNRLDLAATDAGGSVGVLLNNGDGTFAPPVSFLVTIPFELAAGDFNGDGFDDLAVPCCSPASIGSALLVFFSNGDGTFGAPVEYDTAGHNAVVADFNGDGHADIAVTDSETATSPGAVSVLLNNGDGTFANAVPYGTAPGAAGIAIGDLNGDGHPDVATANTISGTVSVLLNHGDGTFSAAASYPSGDSPWKVVVADLNGDRAPDVAVTNASTGTVSVLLNHGDGTLSAGATYAAGNRPGGIGVGDFDGDGHPDLVVSNILDGVSVLFNAGHGTFSRLARTAVDDATAGMAVEDLDGDGTPDVSVASVTRGVAVLLHV